MKKLAALIVALTFPSIANATNPDACADPPCDHGGSGGGGSGGGSCTPHCVNRACGPDGCGGACGYCTSADYCDTSTGQCVCQPTCGGNQCGSDLCGGSCGTCNPHQAVCDGTMCQPTYDFWSGADGAPVTQTRDANGYINHVTAVGFDGITRELKIDQTNEDILDPNGGSYVSTRMTTVVEYQDNGSPSHSTQIVAALYTDGSGFAERITTDGQWVLYKEATGQAYVEMYTVANGFSKYWGTVTQVRDHIANVLAGTFPGFDYFQNTFALMYNEKMNPNTPVWKFVKPQDLPWTRLLGDGVIGATVAIATKATGWGAVVTMASFPIADTWQSDKDLQGLINALLCMSIETLDYLYNGTKLGDAGSLYSRAGCTGN